VVIAAALGGAACGDSAPSDAEVIGSKVRPPKALAPIRPGMARADVEAALPKGVERVERGYRMASGAANVELVVVMAPGADHVAGLEAVIRDADARALLTRAWGPPNGTDEWRDEETGWRAGLACGAAKLCTVAFTPYGPLPTLFPGPEVRPPGAHAGLRFGMSPAEAAAVCAPCGTSVDGARGTPLEVDGVWFAPRYDDGYLAELHYEVPPYARAFLERQWGPSRLRRRGPAELAGWVDLSTRWRAVLQPPMFGRTTPTLMLAPIIPLVELLERLEAIPLRVKSLAEIRAQHPDLFWDAASPRSMTLPPTELDAGRAATHVMLHERSDRVVEIEVPFIAATLFPGGREAIHATLAQKWGKPRREDAGPSERFLYGKRVVVTENDEYIGITLR
jgi:hypothetical protein